MSRKLPNYLKTHRKRSGFTQDEMAFLLGSMSGTNVSRYERFRREPDLRTAFACQVVCGIPAHEIFPGTFEKVEQVTKERARLLLRKLQNSSQTPVTRRKIAVLHGITSGKEAAPQQNL